MAVNITSGSFKIVSRTDGNFPVGINDLDRVVPRPPFQNVYVNLPIRFWKFNQVRDDIYLLTIDDYRYTGVIDNKVVASNLPGHEVTWKITYHEPQAGYTIALANDTSLGWTVIPDSGEVVIRRIITLDSIPPQFLPTQLFVIEPFKK